MGRTTVTGCGAVRRLAVAVAAATSLVIALPSGAAFAATPSDSPALGQLLEQAGQQNNDQQNNGGGGNQQQQNNNQNNGGGNQQQQNNQQQEQQQERDRQAAERDQQQKEQAAKQKAEKEKAEKAAKEKAEAERKAAEAAARERARAAKRAAQLAAATQRARTSWDSHARPSKLTIVRSRTIDIVTNGSLTRQVPRRAGNVTLGDLDRYLPNNWISIENGVAQMSSAIVLSPGVTMEIGGGDVKELKLAGGARPTDAASIYTGSGKLRLRGATVSSVDPASGQPLPTGPGRPFIVVSSDGQFDAVDATISDLGTPLDAADRPGLLFGINSTGSVVRTTFLRNSTGLKLDRSSNIRLEGVTVGESTTDGLVLRGDKGTTLVGIKAERNGANGVLVTGESTDRPITGIQTTGNGGFGVVVANLEKPRVTGVVTTGDGAGGLRVSRSNGAAVTDFVAADTPIGLLAHAGATNVSLDQLRITNSRRGVVVDKSVTGVNLRGTTIEGSDVVAVGIAGKEVQLTDVGLRDSGTGVRIERGAIGITATGLTIAGGKDGVISTPGTTKLMLQNLVTDGVSSTAVRTFTPDAQIMGGRITGSTTGIDTGAATTITGTTITQVDEGIRARSTDVVHADNIDINAITAGITVAEGSPFVLTSSRIDALEAVHGVVQQQGLNELSLPPLNLLGAIGVPLILLALVLEQVNAFRQRSVGAVRRRLPPSLPAGAG